MSETIERVPLPTASEPERVERCETCRFWNEELGRPDADGSRLILSSECRRYAPRPSFGERSAACPVRRFDWPDVEPYDWCGEWQAGRRPGQSPSGKLAPEAVS